jgi:hypothetical protein
MILPCATATGLSPFLNEDFCKPIPHEGENEWLTSHCQGTGQDRYVYLWR